MAKSKGNFYTLGDVLKRGYSAHEIRFLLLSTHYRKMLNFTDEALKQSRAGLERIHNFLVDLDDIKREGTANPEVSGLIAAARAGFMAGLDDDLNVAESMASIYGLIKSANVLKDKEGLAKADAEALRDFICLVDDRILAANVRGVTVRVPALDFLEPEAIQAKISARQKARAERDFALADRIRDELLREGVLLEDTKDGVRWKKIVPPPT
jgi:cysteinyl-tRNA synthetase